MDIRDLKGSELYLINNKNEVSILETRGMTIFGGYVFDICGKTFVTNTYKKDIVGYIIAIFPIKDDDFELKVVNTNKFCTEYNNENVYRIINNKEALEYHFKTVVPKLAVIKGEENKCYNYVIDTSLGMFYTTYGTQRKNKAVFVYHDVEKAREAARKAENVIISNIDKYLEKLNSNLKEHLLALSEVYDKVVELKGIKVGEVYKICFVNNDVLQAKIEKIEEQFIYTNKGIIPLNSETVRKLQFIDNEKVATKKEASEIAYKYHYSRTYVVNLNERIENIKETKKAFQEKTPFGDLPFNIKFTDFKDGVAAALLEPQRESIGILSLKK